MTSPGVAHLTGVGATFTPDTPCVGDLVTLSGTATPGGTVTIKLGPAHKDDMGRESMPDDPDTYTAPAIAADAGGSFRYTFRLNELSPTASGGVLHFQPNTEYAFSASCGGASTGGRAFQTCPGAPSSPASYMLGSSLPANL